MTKYLLIFLSLLLTACMPAAFQISKPDGNKLEVSYYSGGDILDDLLIINGENYFGTASYQFDDPMGDIGFRFNNGERFRSECISVGKDIIGEDVCKLYEVYRSNFDLIPEGSQIPRPQMF